MMRGYGYDGYGPMMGGGTWVGDIVMLVLWLALIVGFVVLVVWAVRTIAASMRGESHTAPPTPQEPLIDGACDIARKRYASGEITKEQYEEICGVLKAPR